MAKKKVRGRRKGSKGPTKKDRIAKLTEILTKNQVKTATTLAKETPFDILRLAMLLAERPVVVTSTVRGLGQQIKSLTPEKQEKARELVAAIKAL